MKPYFRTREVRAITGATVRQTQYFDATRLVSPSRRRGRRVYTFGDLVRVWVILRLKAAGVTIQKARLLLPGLNALQAQLRAPLAGVSILFDGAAFLVFTGEVILPAGDGRLLIRPCEIRERAMKLAEESA